MITFQGYTSASAKMHTPTPDNSVSTGTERSVRRIAISTSTHGALNNQFYDIWLNGRLKPNELEIFANNYYAWIATVPDQIARVFIASPDFKAKCETIKNLFSEMGEGQPEKTHLQLLRNFLRGILSIVSGPDCWEPERDMVLASTDELIRVQTELFGSDRPQLAAGALLAQEWQAYTMLSKLYEGSRLYLPLWRNPDDFHELCEYFYVHLGEAEKEHRAQSVTAAARFATSDELVDLIALGHSTFLSALEKFWNGIATNLNPTAPRFS